MNDPVTVIRLIRHILYWILTLIAFLLSPGTAQSQTGGSVATRRLRVNAGVTHLSRQDKIFSPMVHRDFSILNAGLSYETERTLYQRVGISFGSFSAAVQDPYKYVENGKVKITAPHSFTMVDLAYQLGIPLFTSMRHSLKAGVMATGKMHALNYNYGRLSHFGYFMYMGMGGFVHYLFYPDDVHLFNVVFSMPWIGWKARSPFLVNDDEFIENTQSHHTLRTLAEFWSDGRMSGPSDLMILDLSCRAERRLGGRYLLGVVYSGELIQAQNPRPLFSIRHKWSLTMGINF